MKKAYHQEILDEDDEDEDEANNDDGSVSPKEVTELCSLEFYKNIVLGRALTNLIKNFFESS